LYIESVFEKYDFLGARGNKQNMLNSQFPVIKVALAETFVEYLSDVGNIQDFSATNFSVLLNI
jgi:hypothetical protein